MKKIILILLICFSLLFAACIAAPRSLSIPVKNATSADWNRSTFWHRPWGASGVHKGIDIFAQEGTPVLAAAPGIVIYSGEIARGGLVLAVLDPKGRVHYYAHLKSSRKSAGDLVGRGYVLGSVGATGNAAGTPPHLHYSIISLLPHPARYLPEEYGFLRMFYLNPDEELRRREFPGSE